MAAADKAKRTVTTVGVATIFEAPWMIVGEPGVMAGSGFWA
jgi:hypothetical protein